MAENTKVVEDPLWGPVISSYSRAEAIDDGTLHDVSWLAREAGFKHPVAVTNGVWVSVVEPKGEAKRWGESNEGRLWDVLNMAMYRIRRGTNDESLVTFSVLATDEHGKQQTHELLVHCGPGDKAEPVITIMLKTGEY